MNAADKNFVCEVTDPHESIIQQVSKNMVEDDRAMDLADVFKMFSDSTRLKILYALWQNCSIWGNLRFPISFACCVLPSS